MNISSIWHVKISSVKGNKEASPQKKRNICSFNGNTSSFLDWASAFALWRFTQAWIFASSLWYLQLTRNENSQQIRTHKELTTSTLWRHGWWIWIIHLVSPTTAHPWYKKCTVWKTLAIQLIDFSPINSGQLDPFHSQHKFVKKETTFACLICFLYHFVIHDIYRSFQMNNPDCNSTVCRFLNSIHFTLNSTWFSLLLPKQKLWTPQCSSCSPPSQNDAGSLIPPRPPLPWSSSWTPLNQTAFQAGALLSDSSGAQRCQWRHLKLPKAQTCWRACYAWQVKSSWRECGILRWWSCQWESSPSRCLGAEPQEQLQLQHLSWFQRESFWTKSLLWRVRHI